jgi:hypothetical protein
MQCKYCKSKETQFVINVGELKRHKFEIEGELYVCKK